jgi:hypothetical protein
MRKLIGTIAILSLFTLSVKAQFNISADISPRAELRHGYRIMPGPNDQAAGHINQRTRLAFGWKQDNLRTHISFQDVRNWGQEAQKQVHPSIAIHEAWAELQLSEPTSLKIGRQELRYDNQRFFAINDWIPMGQKHDVALLKRETEKGKLHFGTAFNQEWSAYARNFGTEYRINNYKFMSFLWYNTSITDNGTLSLTAIADGYEYTLSPNILYVRGTWSAYAKYKAGNLDLMLNPAFQNGRTSNGGSISAWYIRAEATANPGKDIRSTLGMEILSGNTPGNMEKYRVFNPTHGAGHANNGFMDYFTNFAEHTRGAGLVNPFLKNSITISEKTTWDVDLHLFYLQNNYQFMGSTINKYLGTEIDLTMNYKFNEFTRIIGGFSWMFGSESMEIIRGGSSEEPAYFAYIMLRIRPKMM